MQNRFLKFFASILMGLGVLVFTCSVLFVAGILMEGVTHRFGEGNIAPPETSEQSIHLLVIVSCLVLGSLVGWLLARIGDWWRRLGSRECLCKIKQLLAEIPLLLGGECLCLGILILWGHRLAAYEVGTVYRQFGIGAGIVGPLLLLVGGLLFRLLTRATP